MIEQSLVIIKPDAVRRKLIGMILNRFETEGLLIKKLKMIQIPRELAEKHYAEHEGKDFYPNLIKFITSGNVVVMILEGENAISFIRELVGATNPAEAEKGTIRGDFKEQPVKSVTENMVHASDSKSSARREIELFF
ncbi:MAG: nucleoside-diphosphate kinase [Candidatus Lokiarchaeota archaeon]|nr:nucleoside-diphosphate kinase [Candidatus Lokiarchaeota archaeon]MBD3202017.1 nucleoside-diphosphate kinase [Candidatus Lokiarchaeota archaeon]